MILNLRLSKSQKGSFQKVMCFLERFMWVPECMVISDVCGKRQNG